MGISLDFFSLSFFFFFFWGGGVSFLLLSLSEYGTCHFISVDIA